MGAWVQLKHLKDSEKGAVLIRKITFDLQKVDALLANEALGLYNSPPKPFLPERRHTQESKRASRLVKSMFQKGY